MSLLHNSGPNIHRHPARNAGLVGGAIASVAAAAMLSPFHSTSPKPRVETAAVCQPEGGHRFTFQAGQGEGSAVADILSHSSPEAQRLCQPVAALAVRTALGTNEYNGPNLPQPGEAHAINVPDRVIIVSK